jgi:hypothetical protein
MSIQLHKRSRHEASHAVVGRFFSHYLIVNSISLDAKSHHLNVEDSQIMGGVVNISVKKLNDKPSIQALIFALWAGFIGQNIFLYGAEKIGNCRKDIYKDPNNWYLEGCDLDYKKIMQLTPYVIEGTDLQPAVHHVHSYRFLIEFFVDKGGWKYVEALARILEETQDRLVEKDELDQIFKQIGFLRFLRWRRYKIMRKFHHRLRFRERLSLFRDTL